MKRMFTAFIVILLFVCILVTASAAGTKTADEAGQSFSLSVKAVFKESGDLNIYKNNVSGGSSSITTRNGTIVTVTGNKETFEPGVRLVVREITAEETEAYGWFTGVLKETGTDILPFDIYFEKDGQRIPLNSKIQITITLPDSYTSPLVCYVTTDGKVEVLPSSIKDGKISFETNYTSYYVLADKIKNPSDIPQTGDNTNLLLYISLTLFSVCILIFMTRRYKKQSKR